MKNITFMVETSPNGHKYAKTIKGSFKEVFLAYSENGFITPPPYEGGGPPTIPYISKLNFSAMMHDDLSC